MVGKTKSVEKKAKTQKVAKTSDADRKSLAAKARELKTELLSIRFNLQSPSIKEYRRKRRELAGLLSQLN